MFRTVVAMILGASLAGATTTFYTDAASWEAAMRQEQPDATILSGFSQLTVDSVSGPEGTYPGFVSIHDGVLSSEVGSPYFASTHFSLDGKRLYGFFADWAIPNTEAGLDIWLSGNGAGRPALTPNSPDPVWGGYLAYSGGWGFVTDQAFDSVVLGANSGEVSFHMSNFEFDPSGLTGVVPEPVAWGLTGLGLVGPGLMMAACAGFQTRAGSRVHAQVRSN